MDGTKMSGWQHNQIHIQYCKVEVQLKERYSTKSASRERLLALTKTVKICNSRHIPQFDSLTRVESLSLSWSSLIIISFYFIWLSIWSTKRTSILKLETYIILSVISFLADFLNSIVCYIQAKPNQMFHPSIWAWSILSKTSGLVFTLYLKQSTTVASTLI